MGAPIRVDNPSLLRPLPETLTRRPIIVADSSQLRPLSEPYRIANLAELELVSDERKAPYRVENVSELEPASRSAPYRVDDPSEIEPIRPDPIPSGPTLANELGASVVQGFGSWLRAPAALHGTAKGLLDTALGMDPPLVPPLPTRGERHLTALSEKGQSLQQRFPRDPAVTGANYLFNDDWTGLSDAPVGTRAMRLAGDVAEGGMSLVPVIAVTAITGPGGLAMLAAGGVGGALEATAKYDQARAAGDDEQTAAKKAAVQGVGTGFLNALPFVDRIGRFLPEKLRGKAADFILRTFAEGATETAEGAIDPVGQLASRPLPNSPEEAAEWLREAAKLPGAMAKGVAAESSVFPSAMILGAGVGAASLAGAQPESTPQQSTEAPISSPGPATPAQQAPAELSDELDALLSALEAPAQPPRFGNRAAAEIVTDLSEIELMPEEPAIQPIQRGGAVPDAVRQDAQFMGAVDRTAANVGVAPEDLLAVIGFETGGTFDPAQTNQAGSGAAGLIQFMPSTARGLGTTTEALAKMDRTEQMGYVEKYLSQHKQRIADAGGGVENLYMAILNPQSLGKPADAVMQTGGRKWTKGSRLYDQNAGFDRDGKGFISVGDVQTSIRERAGEQPAAQLKETPRSRRAWQTPELSESEKVQKEWEENGERVFRQGLENSSSTDLRRAYAFLDRKRRWFIDHGYDQETLDSHQRDMDAVRRVLRQREEAATPARPEKTASTPDAADLTPWQEPLADFVKSQYSPADKAKATKAQKRLEGLKSDYDRVKFRHDQMATGTGQYAKPDEFSQLSRQRGKLANSIKRAEQALSVETGLAQRHRMAVQQALASNLPVPPEVLADYPDLVPAQAPASRPQADTTLDAVTSHGVGFRDELGPEWDRFTLEERQQVIDEDREEWEANLQAERLRLHDQAPPKTLPTYEAPPGRDPWENQKRNRPLMAPMTADDPLDSVAFDPDQVPSVEVPVEWLQLSKDVPQFKENADAATGVVEGEQLKGRFTRVGTAPILVWQRLNGQLEVISGRHRLDLARRSGEKTIPGQVLSEAQGFTRQMAMIADAEGNIRDGQGSLKDYARYFRAREDLTEQQAQEAGLLSRAKGRDGFRLGKNATDDLFSAYEAEVISEKAAVEIAQAAPNNIPAQRQGIRLAIQNSRMSAQEIGNTIRAIVGMGHESALAAGGGAQADLFGGVDDTGFMEEVARRGRIATQMQQRIVDQLRILRAAKIDPAQARAEGIDIEVKDRAAVEKRRQQLLQDQERWKDWHLYPDLVAQVVGQEQPHGVQGALAPALELDPETPVVSQPDLFNPEAGAVNVTTLADAAREGSRRLRDAFQWAFQSRRELPENAFQRNIRRMNNVAARVRDIEVKDRRLRRAVKAAGITMQQVDAALKAPQLLGQFPESVRDLVIDMRQDVDALTREFRRMGLAEGAFAELLLRNEGAYLHRSYRIFRDKKYAKDVPEDVKTRVRDLIRSEFQSHGHAQTMFDRPTHEGVEQTEMDFQTGGMAPLRTMADEQVEGILESLLAVGEESSLFDAIAKGKLGSKDLSIFKYRRDIPQEIRALWGEDTDAGVNYMQSAFKMVSLIENHLFQLDLREMGLREGWLKTEPIANAGGAFVYRVAAPGNPSFDALTQGAPLYATKEVRDAIAQLADEQHGRLARLWFTTNALVHMNKTVLSLQTHPRNFTGNVGIFIANGGHMHLKPAYFKHAAAVTKADLLRKGDSPEHETVLKYTKLGILDQNVHAGTIADLIRLAEQSRSFDDYIEGRARLVVEYSKRGALAMNRLYQAEDNFWKVMGFQMERARLAKDRQALSAEELDTEAARIVRNTMPTYSMARGRFVSFMRKWGIHGSFITWHAEIFRTSKNIILQGMEELRDPARRSTGIERLTGTALASTGISAAAVAASLLVGMDGDDKDDLRRFLPPWQRNATLIHMGQAANGVYNYLDFSYTDPYDILRRPVMTALAGGSRGDVQRATIAAVGELFKPFTDEKILFSALNEVYNNRRESGGTIWNEQADSHAAVALKIAEYLMDKVGPATYAQFKRVGKGITGKVDPSGRSYNALTEAAGIMTGIRPQTTDVRQALGFRSRDYARDERQATSAFTSVAGSRGTVTAQDIEQARLVSEQARQRVHSEFHGDLAAAERLGISRRELLGILKENGVGEQAAKLAIVGRYVPYRPSRQVMHRMRRAQQAN